jgi:hypothetical protein
MLSSDHSFIPFNHHLLQLEDLLNGSNESTTEMTALSGTKNSTPTNQNSSFRNRSKLDSSTRSLPSKDEKRIDFKKKYSVINNEESVSLNSVAIDLLINLIRSSKSNDQDNLKKILRKSDWHISDPIRKQLWKQLLKIEPDVEADPNGKPQSTTSSNVKSKKENDYNELLTTIFGKSKQLF